MPKVTCRCGYVFRLSKITSEQFLVLPEKELDDFLNKADDTPVRGEDIQNFFSKIEIMMLKCPSCNRILLSHRPDDCTYTSYRIERNVQ